MADKPRRKQTLVRTPEQAARLKEGLLRLAESLLEDNTQDFALGYCDAQGTWHLTASNRTFGMGAAVRMGIELKRGLPPQERDP